MKKALFFTILLSCMLLTTSCVDYVQSLTYENGKYHIYHKITFSKVLFAFADEDPEDLLDEIEDFSIDDLPENVEIKPVYTDLEVGTEFSIDINPLDYDEDEKKFIPTIVGNKCYIPFLIGNEDMDLRNQMNSEDSEAEAFASAILSSAKCRVLISKKILRSISVAYFEGRGGQNIPIPIFDYGDSYCLEIPFITLFQSNIYKFNRIVVIKDF